MASAGDSGSPCRRPVQGMAHVIDETRRQIAAADWPSHAIWYNCGTVAGRVARKSETRKNEYGTTVTSEVPWGSRRRRWDPPVQEQVEPAADDQRLARRSLVGQRLPDRLPA